LFIKLRQIDAEWYVYQARLALTSKKRPVSIERGEEKRGPTADRCRPDCLRNSFISPETLAALFFFINNFIIESYSKLGWILPLIKHLKCVIL
jgi:hypothetical protein